MPDPNSSAPAERLDTLRRVELAEGVEIALPVAGPHVRSTAMVLDVLLVMALLAVVGMVIQIPMAVVGLHGLGMGLSYVAYFLVFWGYFAFFECRHRGATPGKRARGLRVVQTSGEPITLSQALVRSFLLNVDLMIGWGLIGLASMVMTRRFQRLGDLAAGTVVIYDEHAPKPPTLASKPYLLPEPAAPAVRLSREEQLALLSYAERAPAWSPERRAELAGLVPRLAGGADARAVQTLLRYGHWLQRRSH